MPSLLSKGGGQLMDNLSSRVISVFQLVLIFLYFSPCFIGIEARKYCDAKTSKVTKSFDKTCDKDFIYCVPGIGGIPATCPENLVFNPKRENCDVPKACEDTKDIDRDCIGKPCGLHGDPGCETYYICSGGNKIRKKCPAGFFFDTENKECLDPTEVEVVCFDDVITKALDPSDIQNDTTSYSTMDAEFCPFHKFKATPNSPPADDKKHGTGIILESPKVTNFGDWQEWVKCPKGMYFTGIAVWKRSIEDDLGKYDHGGIVSLGFKCENPLHLKRPSREESRVIGQYAHGAPDKKWFGFMECDDGAGVGYQLSQLPDQAEQDDVATDNVKMYAICSCGLEKEKFKPYHLKKAAYNKVGNQKGSWTEAKFCQEKQALCAMKTQMQDWSQTNFVKIEKEDMTGLNQLHTKCCDVPSPSSVCSAKETIQYIQSCDNSESSSARPCSVKILVGVTYNVKDYKASVSFYTSIGYTLVETISGLKVAIESDVQCQSDECEVNYDKLDGNKVYRIAKLEQGEVKIEALVKAKVYQVVVECGIFKIYTNTLVTTGTKKDGSETEDESFVI